MIRMLLKGCTMGIRSERRLCEKVHLNLAYRWFCRLDLSDPIPDHSTFSKNRHGRFRDSDLLRHVFETVVARCIKEGLASGQRLAADASLIQADANRQSSTPQADWEQDKIDPSDASRAVREYPETVDDEGFGAASAVEPKFTSQYAISSKLRKEGEMLFAHLKRILKLDWFRLLGPCGAREEFDLEATSQNPRKLAKLFPVPQTPSPA